jgi:tetratricopeptide (TPR) repeat protein
MAAASEKRLEDRMKKMDSAEVNAVMLNFRGVSATNQNDWLTARQDFLNAYSLDPADAFSLNNRGYVAEMDGDLETAQLFYEKARRARDSNDRVGLATQQAAEGKRLFTVAGDSDHQVDGKLDEYSRDRLKLIGPIKLIPRNDAADGELNVTPDAPPSSNVPSASVPSAPSTQ